MNMNNILNKRKLFVKFIETSGFLKSKALHTYKIVAIVFTCILLIISLANYYILWD